MDRFTTAKFESNNNRSKRICKGIYVVAKRDCRIPLIRVEFTAYDSWTDFIDQVKEVFDFLSFLSYTMNRTLALMLTEC